LAGWWSRVTVLLIGFHKGKLAGDFGLARRILPHSMVLPGKLFSRRNLSS
jgi:hypothetical protein